jgi:hypothetical protein
MRAQFTTERHAIPGQAMEDLMLSDSKVAAWLASRRRISVAGFAILLFCGHYALIQILSWRAIKEGSTLIDDFAIAALGGAALWFFLTLQAERHEIAHARERLMVTARLNLHIRRALSVVATSVVLPNEDDRLRLLDEAVESIDHVLMDMVPTADEQDRLRFYLEQSR